MLRRQDGATIAQIVEATGWQPHTVRGALAGALKKRLGLDVASEKVEGAGGSTRPSAEPLVPITPPRARAAAPHSGVRWSLAMAFN